MSSSRPCTCNNISRGKPKSSDQCEQCWRYWQDLTFHKQHGGQGCFVGNTIVEPCPTQLLSLAPPQKQQEGPGTELKLLLESLGIKETAGCNCDAKIQQMNDWGPGVCDLRRHEIINWLQGQYDKQGWDSLIAAGIKSMLQGLPISPLNPIASLVDLAIKRAKEKKHA